MNVPWSKRHKRDFAKKTWNLSNSFVHPLTHPELVQLTRDHNNDEESEALLAEYHNHSLEYTANGGSWDLRNDIATLYYGDSPEITADHILVTAGGQVAIQLAAQAFFANNNRKHSDTSSSSSPPHAIVFTPGYQSVVESPTWFGGSQTNSNDHDNANVTYIRRRARQNWQVDVTAVRDAIRPHRTKYLVLNEPYNPAGTLMSRTVQHELIALCHQHNIIIVCDEVYRLLEHDEDGKTSRLPPMVQAYPERGVSIVAMSKPWGACGITIGWIACQNADMMDQLWDCHYFGTACMSRASELQARMVLRVSDVIVQDRLAIIRHNKALLQTIIERDYPDLLEWQRPTAGAICFCKFKGPLTSLELGSILSARGISIKPAYCFMDDKQQQQTQTQTQKPNNNDNNNNDVVDDDDDDDDLASYFRIGYGERCIPQALEAFVAVLEEYKDEWRATMRQNQKKC